MELGTPVDFGSIQLFLQTARADTTLKLTNQDPGEAGLIFGFEKDCEPGWASRGVYK